MDLCNKKILIISPERWGTIKVSKHHYAIALAKKGNVVYFLDPVTKATEIKGSLIRTETQNLFVMRCNPLLRGTARLRKRFPKLADWLLELEIKRLIKLAGSQFDIVWNFDAFRFENLKLFKPAFTIFHVVDAVDGRDKTIAASSDLILCVSDSILERYEALGKPVYFINHGLSDPFVKRITEKAIYTESTANEITRCGYVGNLLSKAIHYEILYNIVKSNPTVQFDFIGPSHLSNLGEFAENIVIEEIQKLPNVVFHGQKEPEEVARLIGDVDLFLVCYYPEKVGEAAVSNNHKLLEYLSTGKLVVSTYSSSYKNLFEGLFEMVLNTDDLPKRFSSSIQNLAELNNETLQQKRIDFAKQNSYTNHLITIEKILKELS